jgi:uncharacterized protein YwlG (UPF0340 family)
MIKYELIPGRGIGPIRFGMSHREVYEAMGAKPVSVIPRGKTSGAETVSSFHNNGCFKVHYSSEDMTVEYIEVSRGDDVAVFYKGMDILNPPVCYRTEKEF